MGKIWTTRNRALFVGVGLATIFTVFSGRLVQLSDEGGKQARGEKPKMRSIRERNDTLYAHRGSIFDKHGEVLASEVRVSRVIADPSLIPQPEDPGPKAEKYKVEQFKLAQEHLNTIADLLVKHLGMNRQEAMEQLTSRKHYLILTRKTPQENALALVRELHDLNLPGIYLEHDWERVYPNGATLSQVVGHTNDEHTGIAGLEQSADSLLKGIDGSRKFKTDQSGRELIQFRREEVPPKDGCSLRLTLDLGAQAIIDRELDAIVAKYKPEKTTIVVMNPHTGDIIAMGSRPTYDLRDWKKAPPKVRHNPAVQDVYEPGSTFKIVAASAALNEGLVNPNTTIFCHNGSFMYKGMELKDHHGYGDLTITNIIAKSSNIGAAQLALQLGGNRFYSYIQAYGFGEKTGVKLPAESPGICTPVGKWNNQSITRIPMGQSIAVTPMQMVTAMSVIANGGMLLEPRVIDAYVDERGETITPMPVSPRRRVLKEETARQMREMLVKVTQKGGTALLAAIPGYDVGGKTGTAQKVREGHAGYVHGKYVVSFLGFLPADDPAFVALVVVDAPQTSEADAYGGTVAAPSFAKIGAELAAYLDLQPDEAAGVAEAR